jgi:hypothetical protein
MTVEIPTGKSDNPHLQLQFYTYLQPLASDRFMAKGHAVYLGLICRPQLEE